MIRIESVSKQYSDDKEVLKGISFSIDKGDFVAVVGPSGCGKSTLLNMIAGYDTPTEGHVLMNGVSIEGPSYKRAVVSQDNTLFPWLNVERNIAYGLKIRGQNRATIQSKTSSILEDVGLLEYRHHKIFELSGGMRQRVALARTLINDSELILMDEPLGALDSLTRASMQSLVHQLWLEQSLTIMMITHDIEEALLLANKVIVLSDQPGSVIAEFYPDFYKNDNLDDLSVNEEFTSMKLEILQLL